MNIPIRPIGSVFDVLERPRPLFAPVLPTPGQAPAGLPAASYQLPTGRDVSRELDQLFSRLAARAAERRSETRLDRDSAQPGAHASLASLGQLNGAATSYGKVHLSFGSSTSVATLSGSYAGTGAAASATALRVDINQAATMGANPTALKFTVSDQVGNVLYTYDGLAKAGQNISLGADVGLQIAFSAGTLMAASNNQTSVSRTVATNVDANARFLDPDPNLRPRFEGGVQVVPGSFVINGQRIEVRADDSIAAVLQRISVNVPGIEASFADDKVRLASRVQSREPIVVGDDSSGFLAAMKLLGGEVSGGQAAGGNERLSLMAQFAQVRAGGFRLGGHWVAVDPASDTLSSVMARMREAAPNVLAYVDRQQRVVVRASSDDSVMLGDDSSGFLAAVGLASGRLMPVRDRFQLDAGTTQRLQQAASGQKAQLVRELLEYLGVATPTPQPVEGNKGGTAQASQTAPKAQAQASSARKAYQRDAGERVDVQ